MTALNDTSVRFRAYTFDLGKNYELRFFDDEDKMKTYDSWLREIVTTAEEISVVSLDHEDIEIDFACLLPDVAIEVVAVDEEEQTAIMVFEQGDFVLHAKIELDVMSEEELAELEAAEAELLGV